MARPTSQVGAPRVEATAIPTSAQCATPPPLSLQSLCQRQPPAAHPLVDAGTGAVQTGERRSSLATFAIALLAISMCYRTTREHTRERNLLNVRNAIKDLHGTTT